MTHTVNRETIKAIIQVAVQKPAMDIDVFQLKNSLVGAGLPDDNNTFQLAWGIRAGIFDAQWSEPLKWVRAG
jgi:hypothetical protein